MAAMAAVRWSLRVASRQAARALLAAARRVRWRLLGCLLGCLALGVTASALIGQTRHAAQFAAERTTSALPVPVLVDAGPPPGPLLPLWQVTTGNVADLAIQGGQIGYGLVDGQLVVVSGAGIDARDARTGSPRWHYYRKGWMLVGWAATRTEIAAFFQRVAEPLAHILAVLDAPTGRTLWQSARDRPVGIGPSSLRWLSGPEAFLVSRDGRVIRGVASRDGWTLWSRQLPAGCAVSASGAYGSDGDDTDVDVFSAVCGSSRRLVAVNPVDGNIRWRERSGTGAAAAVTVQHGITSVWDGDVLQVLSSTGRRLLRDSGDELCGDVCRIAVADGRVILAYSPDGTGQVLQAIDIRRGLTTWQRRAGHYQALTDAGGRIYALSSTLAEGLIPARLDVVDPQTGQATTVALPLAFRSGAGSRPWLAAGGGLLFASYPLEFDGPAGGFRVVALRSAPPGPGPTALGGVKQQDWPDTCRLVNGHDLASAFLGVGYRHVPTEVSLTGLRLRTGCEYRPVRVGADGDDGADAEIVTGWVAVTSEQAARLLADLRATYQRAERLPGVGDEAYGLGTPVGPVAVRVGRVIIMVRADQSLGAATALARAAALRLGQNGLSP